ncbi:MAG: hypothetical protein HC888_01765 [Candidatus Competibacteraceae bacterium]|nr:hypothetical protein [Candidatus Competibacteraceae bacterium]
MAISSTNLVITYRQSDDASLELAQYYQDFYDLDPSQLIELPCSSNEILADETTYETEVLSTLKTAIQTLEVSGRSIYIAILGYNVPAGYIDGFDIISGASRVARINHPFQKRSPNPIYNRQTFQRYDSLDAAQALIVSRIDAYNLELAKSLIGRAFDIKNRVFANGTFYLDPYSDIHGDLADAYRDLLIDFQLRTLRKMNLPSFVTTFIDPYLDSVIPSVENDSFVWSWFSDRGSDSFFRETSSLRIFFYNADFDGAETVRDIGERRWPVLSMRNGYAAIGSQMSNPGYDGFLNPRAFYEAILQSATVGEAHLFATPYLNWTNVLFGDPLLTFSFPTAEEFDINQGLIDEDETVRLMTLDLARAMAHHYKKESLLEEARNKVVLTHNVTVEVELLRPMQTLYSQNNEGRRSAEFTNVINKLLQFVERRNRFLDLNTPMPTFDDYLQAKNLQISELIYDAFPNRERISINRLLPSGWWQIELPVLDDAAAFAFYHFELDVSTDDDFNDIVHAIKSRDDQNGWTWEKNTNEFEPLTSGGVTSSYVGNRIRFTAPSSMYLTRGETYYFRIRQLDQLTSYDYRYFTDIIST